MRPTAPTVQFVGRQSSSLGRLLRITSLLLATLNLVACVPPTPAQKASEAAREMNMAARWGKMDEARSKIAPKNLEKFAKNHEKWHGELRIVETELAGFNMLDATHAAVQVDVSWNFDDDPTLRLTRVSQDWTEVKGKWLMSREKHLSGDPGLFGEKVEREEKHRDKHFPSRVIH